MDKVFKLMYGSRKNSAVELSKLEELAKTLVDSGIHVVVSPNIDVDTFTKWSFISAMACTGAYFVTTMGSLQRDGEERKVFYALLLECARHGNILQQQGPKSGATVGEENSV